MEYNWIKTDSEERISRFKQLIEDGLEVPTRRTLEGRWKNVICHSGYNKHSGDLCITNDEYEDWEEVEASEALMGLEFLDPEPQWEQMTEETKVEDGQFIVIRRSKHHGYHKIFAQWSIVHGRFFSNSTPVPVSVEDCFIRIPSSN